MSYDVARTWLTATAVGITIALAVVLAILDKSATVIATVGVICLAGCFVLNIPELSSLKIWSLEAKMRSAIDRANATIEQVRELATTLAEPMLGSLQQKGRFAGRNDRSENNEAKERVVDSLKSLGVSVEQLNRATSVYDYYIFVDLYFDAYKIASLSANQTGLSDAKIRECFNVVGSPFISAAPMREVADVRRCLEKLHPLSPEMLYRRAYELTCVNHG